MCECMNGSIEKHGTFLDTCKAILCTFFNACRSTNAPHVASVNASTEQRGEQHFQPHVERFVERHAS